MRADLSFAVMGTTAHVTVVDGPNGAPEAAARRLHALEALWSRFRPTSELCRLNRERTLTVSPETARLVALAIDGWWTTSGLFDPSVLDALEAAGYDRTFETLGGEIAARPSSPSPGCADVEVDLDSGLVRLPEGVRLDLGGVAKGFAADLVAAEVMDLGAAGVAVSIGGDVRVMGMAPDGVDGSWPVAVMRPDGTAGPTLEVSGGIVTSSVRRRRWHTRLGDHHHLIDPRTGRPSRTDRCQVTVLAPTAAVAEMLATALLLGDDDPIVASALAAHGAHAFVVAEVAG